MKIKRFFLPVILLLALIFCGCGRKKEDAKTEPLKPKTVVSRNTEAEETEEAPEVIYYKVQLSGTTLALYEIDGESRKTVTSMEINPEFYPEEDISKLKNGIEAYCKEDGYEILENFAN